MRQIVGLMKDIIYTCEIYFTVLMVSASYVLSEGQNLPQSKIISRVSASDQAFRMCQLISHCPCEGMGMITHEHTHRIFIVIQT